MKIALIGYGKMGKSIEKIAKQKGLSIVYTTNRSIEIEKLKQAEDNSPRCKVEVILKAHN